MASLLFANVRDEVSLLASGTKACSAGDVPEVPKAQGLTPSACSAYSFVVKGDTLLWHSVRYKKRRHGGKGK